MTESVAKRKSIKSKKKKKLSLSTLLSLSSFIVFFWINQISFLFFSAMSLRQQQYRKRRIMCCSLFVFFLKNENTFFQSLNRQWEGEGEEELGEEADNEEEEVGDGVESVEDEHSEGEKSGGRRRWRRNRERKKRLSFFFK